MAFNVGRPTKGRPAGQRGTKRSCCAGLLVAVVVWIGGCAPDAEADPDCRSRAFHWSRTEPEINLRHIFCGELSGGRARGLHATALMATAPAVAGLGERSDEGRGIYTAIVRFADGQRKLSTFFPDACDWRSIEASVVHAATHPLRDHRQWGRIGLSAPAAGAAGYCLDARNRPFEIRFAARSDGRINTAFPN